MESSTRLDLARSAVRYIFSRPTEAYEQPVPNCPEWTVHNAAVHVGRAMVAWESMIGFEANDPDAGAAAVAERDKRPSGVPVDVLASWANSCLDAMAGHPDAPCFYPLTGGAGTLGLWAWHAASELGVHRLDVEAALGDAPSMDAAAAADAARWATELVLPLMRDLSGDSLVTLQATVVDADGSELAQVSVAGSQEGHVVVAGPAIQVLLALWGRPHENVVVTDGQEQEWQRWQNLPSSQFQFGAWT